MAPFDFASLTAADADLPATRRGREATPIPANITQDVKQSYEMDKGKGKVYKIARGGQATKDDGKTVLEGDENDKNVRATIALLRRAATTLGYGLSVSVGEGNGKAVPVMFRAQDKAKRRTKAERRADAVSEWIETLNGEDYAEVESIEDVPGWAEMDEDTQSIVTEAWEQAFPSAEDDTAEA